jgi:hypothetical protein
MAQIKCAACQTVLELKKDTTICTCGHCGQHLSVPAHTASTPQFRKQVQYLHHTRDANGDVIFFFKEPIKKDAGVMQSSPILAIAGSSSAVLDVAEHGRLGKYVIKTQNTIYEVQMPVDKADHLKMELVSRYGVLVED